MIITHINEYFNKNIVQSTKIMLDKYCTTYYYKNVQSTNERGENMKKMTFRQKRDLLNKFEPFIIGGVQLISALAGAAVGIAICYFF